jgi:hypothetical protein
LNFTMLQRLRKLAPDFYLFAVASVIAHAIILALLIFGLPQFKPNPDDKREIEVQLEAPKEAKPEPKKAEPKKPEPKKPEPKPQAAAQPKPPPPPPPPKQAKAPEPPQKPKPENEPKKDTAAKPPAMLKPVYKFGEKDAGKDQPLNDAQREAKTAGEKTAPEQKKPPAPAQITTPPQNSLPGVRTSPAPPVAKPGETAKQRPSPARTGDEVATTAMGDVPRGIRAGQLCITELRRQLNNASPPYWPDLLPAYRLDSGNLLQVRKGAFRENARWYNLEFSCEVDDAATSVVSLRFGVGGAVPRAEWRSRGFPSP